MLEDSEIERQKNGTPLLMRAGQILDALGGAELLFGDMAREGNRGFSSVATDSRKVAPGSLFVPLIGEKQDGHDYIPVAVEAGASVVFVDKTHAASQESLLRGIYDDKGTLFFAVHDTLAALQDVAAAYVAMFPNLLKVAVTGSSGKTTVKEMLAAVFSQKYKTVKNLGNLNSETGLPLSVFQIRAEHEAGVFELGMNRRNEIAEIARVLLPNLALITNIGSAHVGILGSRRAIAEEKKNVFAFFDDSCAGFVPASDDFASFLSDVPAGKVFFYGDAPGKENAEENAGGGRLFVSGVSETEDMGLRGSRIRYRGEDIFLRIPGRFNLKNALGVIALAEYAGFSAREIKAGLESVSVIPGRMEILDVSGAGRNLTVIKDCYNANPDSMLHALDFCAALPRTGRLVLVLGSMLELGEASVGFHMDVLHRALTSCASAVFLFGGEMTEALAACRADAVAQTAAAAATSPDVFTPDSIETLSAELDAYLRDGDTVLLKGSRGMALERVLPALSESESVREASRA